MTPRRRRLPLRSDTIRVLTPLDLRDARGGLVAITDDCPSEPTNCYKYCSD